MFLRDPPTFQVTECLTSPGRPCERGGSEYHRPVGYCAMQMRKNRLERNSHANLIVKVETHP
jgi:hypothetical protein